MGSDARIIIISIKSRRDERDFATMTLVTARLLRRFTYLKMWVRVVQKKASAALPPRSRHCNILVCFCCFFQFILKKTYLPFEFQMFSCWRHHLDTLLISTRTFCSICIRDAKVFLWFFISGRSFLMVLMLSKM